MKHLRVAPLVSCCKKEGHKKKSVLLLYAVLEKAFSKILIVGYSLFIHAYFTFCQSFSCPFSSLLVSFLSTWTMHLNLPFLSGTIFLFSMNSAIVIFACLLVKLLTHCGLCLFRCRKNLQAQRQSQPHLHQQDCHKKIRQLQLH